MEQRSTSTTIMKASNLLEALARTGRPASLAELSEVLPYPKPTLRRLLKQLIDAGMVHQDARNLRYRLGSRLITLAAAVLDEMDVRRAAAPLLEELMESTGESVYLAVLDETNIVYIDVVETDRSVRVLTKVGTRRPAHTTATGKAILASLGEESWRPIVSRLLSAVTPATVTSPIKLVQQLKEIRKQGFAVAIDEAEVGVTGVAAPVSNVDGRCIAAVGVAIPSYRFDDRVRRETVRRTIETAQALSNLLSHAPEVVPQLP